MSKPDYKLVRIPRNAAVMLESFTRKKNNGIIRVNAAHFIGDAILEKLQREKKEAA
jgi:hypothetical protein